MRVSRCLVRASVVGAFHAALRAPFSAEEVKVLIDAYERAGYALLEIPQDSVENRVAFVRSLITQGG